MATPEGGQSKLPDRESETEEIARLKQELENEKQGRQAAEEGYREAKQVIESERQETEELKQMIERRDRELEEARQIIEELKPHKQQVGRLEKRVRKSEEEKLRLEEELQAARTSVQESASLKHELVGAKKRIAELEPISAENQELKQEIEQLEQKIIELQHDSLTGLENRGVFFERLYNDIASHLEDERLLEILGQDSLNKEDKKYLDGINFSVTSIDLGYLSKYNDDERIIQAYGGGPHAGGDFILKKTADNIRGVIGGAEPETPEEERKNRAYRRGGDEFTIIHDLSAEEADKLMRKIQKRHSKLEVEGSDLPPALNYGVASVREAVDAFVKAIPPEMKEEMAKEKGRMVEKLQEFLVNISDRRSKRTKAFERISMMTRLKIEDDEKGTDKLDRNFDFLSKGALHLEREEFDRLADIDDANELNEEIKRLVNEKLAFIETTVRKQAERESAVVAAIADREDLF